MYYYQRKTELPAILITFIQHLGGWTNEILKTLIAGSEHLLECLALLSQTKRKELIMTSH